MAIGPPGKTSDVSSAELVLSLERRIDVWITDTWSEQEDAYPLPFWVLFSSNEREFRLMLERYREHWSSVAVIRKNDAHYLQLRR